MKASGNSDPMQCVQNLVSIVRGENPYDRVKGIDPTLIDKDYRSAAPLIRQDVTWLIDRYEPRVNINDVNLDKLAAQVGDFRMNIKATLDQ